MEAFTVYPAIDIRGGNCVRLLQGDYDQETVYGNSPLDMAKKFQAEGADWIHVVDLDGAKEGAPLNDDHVLEIKNNLNVNVQIGGGIRTKQDAEHYFQNGVDRIILGSSAISRPDFVIDMLEQYGNQIAIGIDARNGYAAVEGWTKTSTVKAEELAVQLVRHGAETFIFTDISKDGTLTGPNVQAIKELARATGKEVIASGGMSSLEDIETLTVEKDAGISGAIVGKALYTNAFTLKEALRKAGKGC